MSRSRKAITSSNVQISGHSVEELLVILWALLNNYGCDIHELFNEAIDNTPRDMEPEARHFIIKLLGRFKMQHKSFAKLEHEFLKISAQILAESCACGKEHEFDREYILRKYAPEKAVKKIGKIASA